MIKHSFLLITLIISALFLTTVRADQNLLNNVQVQSFIQDLVAHDHFKRSDLEAIFRNVRPIPEVVQHMQHPAEAASWATYQKLFVTTKRINDGAEFLRDNRARFQATENTYHVPATIITAILGVESNYGKHIMKYRAIDALTHLAFNYPSRQTFFLAELKSFLEVSRQYDLNIDQIYGSYAGAIGPAQFMPDSVQRYAILSNQELDLNNPENWIESIGNYFLKKGWQANKSLIDPIKCPTSIPANIVPNSTKNFYTSQQLREAGITNNAKEDAMFLEFKSPTGTECWLAYHNFAVIMRYNTSPLYAMAVVQLSQNLSSSFGEI